MIMPCFVYESVISDVHLVEVELGMIPPVGDILEITTTTPGTFFPFCVAVSMLQVMYYRIDLVTLHLKDDYTVSRIDIIVTLVEWHSAGPHG